MYKVVVAYDRREFWQTCQRLDLNPHKTHYVNYYMGKIPEGYKAHHIYYAKSWYKGFRALHNTIRHNT